MGIRHDDAGEEFADMCRLALSDSRVGIEPHIFYGPDVRASQRQEAGNEDELGDEARGDISAHGFWKRNRTTIFDVCITDADARCYGNMSSEKVVEQHAKRDRKSTRLNSSHSQQSRMPSSA